MIMMMVVPCSGFPGSLLRVPALDVCFGLDLPLGTSIFPWDSSIGSPLWSDIPVQWLFVGF